MRAVFAGTPEFAVPSLGALLASWDVVAVYTQPDRPAGRGRSLRQSAVKQFALQHDLAVRQPPSLKSAAVRRELAALRPDVLVVAAYGLILPQAVLDIPPHACLNVHASLLPRWRGAAPIQRAVLAGDRRTGITIMRMEAGLDTGAIVCQRQCAITDEDTAGSLHDRLAELGAQTLQACLPDWLEGRVAAVPQSADGVTYANRLTREEARIDWQEDAAQLNRAVRAYNPWPVAYTRWQDRPVKIWQARAVEGSSAEPGRVTAAGADGIDVAAGRGVLRITRLQLPGKRPVSAADFCNAHDLRGARFGA